MDPPLIPPRPAWAEARAPVAGPPPLTKRQLKRRREKANRLRRRAADPVELAPVEAAPDPGVIDPAEEAAVARRVAAQFNRRRPTPSDQHREAIEDHHLRRGDRWRYGQVEP